jgi:ABC-type branched-subunit amino acid transport system permease subunit
MENPYQSPEEPCTPPPDGEPDRRPPGLVHHVRVVAILMIVQGALELLAGVGLGAFAIVMPQVMRADLQRAPQPQPMPANMFWVITVIYGGMAAAALAAALLHITAGLRNYRFRGRILGIVALASGLLTFFTCYCLPTAVGVGVYGLIVFLDGSTTEAFAMGEAGCSSSEILTTFRR